MENMNILGYKYTHTHTYRMSMLRHITKHCRKTQTQAHSAALSGVQRLTCRTLTLPQAGLQTILEPGELIPKCK